MLGNINFVIHMVQCVPSVYVHAREIKKCKILVNNIVQSHIIPPQFNIISFDLEKTIYEIATKSSKPESYKEKIHTWGISETDSLVLSPLIDILIIINNHHFNLPS